MDINKSQNIHNIFSKKQGSHSIANARALELLNALIQLDNSKFPILEIGAGIGTITATLLSITKQKIYAQEFNENCIIKLSKIKRNNSKRLDISKQIYANAYKFIIIDGPYDKNQMFKAIRSSTSSLVWVAIENDRTATRIQIASSLYKAGFRQSMVEFRRLNYKPSLTVFFVDYPPYKLRAQSAVDYLVILIKLWPRYIKLLVKNGRKHYKVGKIIEHEFGKV